MRVSSIAVASLLVITTATARDSATEREIAERVFDGRKAFDAFRFASHVTAERLHCKTPGICISSSLADYRRDSPRSLSAGQVEQVRNLFSRHDSYSPDLWRLKPRQFDLKACGVEYGVLFTFHSVPEVRIALCFKCDEFGVFLGTDDHSEHVNRGTELSFMRSRLVPLIKSIYPHDSQIQNLPLKRP
jgi:hypothetical protein